MRPTLDDLKKIDTKVMYDEFIGSNFHKITEEDINGREVLDIGANVGFSAMSFLYRGAKRVIAVEANLDNYRNLVQNTVGWPIVPLHVAAADGVVKYVSTIEEKGISKTIDDGKGTIPAMGLHALMELFPRDDNDLILKCDIEGQEYDFLLSAAKSDLRRFKVIFLETHQTPHLEKLPARHRKYILEYFQLFGYKMVSETPIMWWNYGKDGKVINCVALEDQGDAKLVRL